MEVVSKFASRYPEICLVQVDGAACAVMRLVVMGGKYDGLYLRGIAEDAAGNRCRVQGFVEQSDCMSAYEHIRVWHTPTSRHRKNRSGALRDLSSMRTMHSPPLSAANISTPETLLRRCRAIGG